MKPSVSTPEPALDATFDHILEYWSVLTRSGKTLAFPLSGRFVKAGQSHRNVAYQITHNIDHLSSQDIAETFVQYLHSNSVFEF